MSREIISLLKEAGIDDDRLELVEAGELDPTAVLKDFMAAKESQAAQSARVRTLSENSSGSVAAENEQLLNELRFEKAFSRVIQVLARRGLKDPVAAEKMIRDYVMNVYDGQDGGFFTKKGDIRAISTAKEIVDSFLSTFAPSLDQAAASSTNTPAGANNRPGWSAGLQAMANNIGYQPKTQREPLPPATLMKIRSNKWHIVDQPRGVGSNETVKHPLSDKELQEWWQNGKLDHLPLR